MATTVPGLPGQKQSDEHERDGFSRLLMVGTSIFGGSSAIFLVVQLIHEEPERAFSLLNAWGPGYLLALFIAFLVNRLMSRMMDGAQRAADRSAEAVERVAAQMQSIAEATHAQAQAMQTTADKDDRDKQEMQILIGVVNSKVEQALGDLRLHGKTIEGTLDEIRRQNRALERIEDALKINRTEESDPK